MRRQQIKSPAPKNIRCAIYTRKSTEEGLQQEFNSLDAQREAGEAYIKSQLHEGWVCSPTQYDDGGFTGANMDRPGLRQLIADIEAGKIDCVVVYKVDRLSRSLLDFGKIIEVFERHKVSFVSVTQAFNTATSMGRLILNVLLSFAQFEREMISERTRDKIAAARRKGKWSGGMPVLGYNVVDTKLVVDPGEAEIVRQIFEMYLERQSLLAVSDELNLRGWRTKRWNTRKGSVRGGRLVDKNSLHQLLTNPTYIGKVRYKEEVHAGEHQAIVPEDVFNRVQSLLERNGRSGGRGVRNKHGALLRGLLQCKPCKCGMSHSYTTRGKREYRYYVCNRAQKRGWQTCPAPSIPAAEIERFVVGEIKAIGRDPELIRETLAQAREQIESQVRKLQAERARLVGQLRSDHAELVQLASQPRPSDSQLATLHERIHCAEQQISAIDAELSMLEQMTVRDAEIAQALLRFDEVWDGLTPREQARIFELLIECVLYDGDAGSISITFRPSGIEALDREFTERKDDAA
ncbi:DNA-invertase hin [Anatilimnocola aggregata]|uniref:DNA-invertase hin n=1 Tax=Anatilimnocola aggregata TaxID=2528021 RepID=A0A517YFE0_9BACT|nr:recombinase family protein [Anatilimnocola aggregata]QDU28946.1 DNA-invertase hin [Anatilimnocola aggregata]